MKLYKVQAPDGSIIKIEGPEGASEQEVIRQAQLLYKKPEAEQVKAPEKTAGDYVKEFGQSAASLADTILGAPAALGQQVGYGVGRAFGLSPEEATRSSMKVTEPFMTPVGSAFGVTNTPAYQNEASKRIMQGVHENVVQPIASATGMPEQDVGSIVGSATMAAGPLMGRAGQAVGRGVYAAEPYIAGAAKLPVEAVKAPINFAKGAIRGVSEPYNEATSAMVPLREQYTPVPAAERFMGKLPTPPSEFNPSPTGPVPPQTLEQLQTQVRPTSELITSPMDKFATITAPKAPTGEPLVPLQGRGMEAWGERVGRGVIQHPLQAMAELGLTAATGIPFKTIFQGASELAARRLASKTGFSPEFPKAVQAAEQRQAAQPVAPVAPTPAPNYPLTVQGPGQAVAPSIIPMGGPQRAVNIEGQRSVLPHQINTANSAAQTPKQVSQQMAAQKLQQTTQPQAPAPAPVAQPVAPAANLPEQRWTDAERLQVQQAMNQPKVETPTEKPPIAEPTLLGPKGPTPYKDSLLKKYGSEKLVGEKATEVERALVKQELYPEKHATVSVSGSHASKLKNVLNEAEASGQPFRVTVTGKNGGYEMIYNSDSFKFAGDNSLKITKAKLIDRNSIDFSGTTSEGVPFTAETRGANTIIKDTSGNVIAEYKGAQQVSGPSKKGPSNVSQMLTGAPKDTSKLGQSIVDKRSFNSDLQKYRYGTEKNPLTMEELNHIRTSDFIDHQNTRDSLMGMNPEHTEYSLWYRDKTGKVQNIQTYGKEIKKK